MSDFDKSPAVLLGEAGALLACWALALPHSDDDLKVNGDRGAASVLQASMLAIASLLRAVDDGVSEPPQLATEVQHAYFLADMLETALWNLTTAPTPDKQLSAGDLRNACNRVRDHVAVAAGLLAELQVHGPDAIAVDKAWARRRQQAGAAA